jgi:hypothetical protein
MGGAISLLPLHALIEWTGAFPLFYKSQERTNPSNKNQSNQAKNILSY